MAARVARTLRSSSSLLAARSSRVAPRVFQQQYRKYSSEAPKKSNSTGIFLAAAAVAGAGAVYFYTDGSLLKGSSGEKAGLVEPKFEDYSKVYKAIADRLIEHDEYEDGSYGPVLLRLAWHCSGTYDKVSKTGGSNGATMRFKAESEHGANAGLKIARDFLEPIKQQFPWISYGDLWTLAGVAAVQEMQGPVIPWRPGRRDLDENYQTPDGRLPDAAQGQDHLRFIFNRMGFNDQEIVALAGAHALGRCHKERSGFEGPWTFSPTVLTNDFFKLLVDEKWHWNSEGGLAQYRDNKTKTLMMLPADMSLIKDRSFRKYVDLYAKDQDAFFKDFSAVITTLFELGVPFQGTEADRMTFKPVHV